jgi:hypothetical protein
MRLSVAPVGSVAFLVHSAASCSPGASSPSPPLSCNGVTRAVACQMQTGGVDGLGVTAPKQLWRALARTCRRCPAV